jgi:hypothetical protein
MYVLPCGISPRHLSLDMAPVADVVQLGVSKAGSTRSLLPQHRLLCCNVHRLASPGMMLCSHCCLGSDAACVAAGDIGREQLSEAVIGYNNKEHAKVSRT